MDIKQFLTEWEFYNGKRNSQMQWYPLQLQILTKMNFNKRIFVFDEVGAGKTIEAGLAIWKTCLENHNSKILIITQGMVIEQYKNEIDANFGIKFINVDRTEKRNILNIKSLFNNTVCNFIITNSSASNISKCILDKGEWDLVIIDEAHNFMNYKSLRSKNISDIRTKKLIMFTATPIRNRLEELESLIDLSQEMTDDENTISLPTAQDFLNQYDERSCWMRNFKAVIKKDYRERKIDVWKYDYRKSNRDIDVFSKIKNNDYWNLGNVFLLWGANKDEFEHNPKKYLKDTYQLSSVDEILDIDNKAYILIQELSKIKKQNLKAIIFCRRKATIRYLEYICYEKGFTTRVLSGEQREDERNKALEEAKKENIDVFIIMDKIGEVGLNLPEYNYVINYELPFSPADLEQRLGRIDRLVGIANSKPIYSIYMIHEEYDKEMFYDNRLFYMNMYKFLPTTITQIPSRNVLFDAEMILQCTDKMNIENQRQLKIMKEAQEMLATINNVQEFKKDIIGLKQEGLYDLVDKYKICDEVISYLLEKKDEIIENSNDPKDIIEIIDLRQDKINRDLRDLEKSIKLAHDNKDKLKNIGNGIFYYKNNMLQVKKLKDSNFIEDVYFKVEKGLIYPIVESFNTVEEIHLRNSMIQNRLVDMSTNIKELSDIFKSNSIKQNKWRIDSILKNEYMQADLIKLYEKEILEIVNISENELKSLAIVINEYIDYKELNKKDDNQKIALKYEVDYLQQQVKIKISLEDRWKYYLYGEDNCDFELQNNRDEQYEIYFIQYFYCRLPSICGLETFYENMKVEIFLKYLDGKLLFIDDKYYKAMPISKLNMKLHKFDIIIDTDSKDIYESATRKYNNKAKTKTRLDELFVKKQYPGNLSSGKIDGGWCPIETLLDCAVETTINYSKEQLAAYITQNNMEEVKFYKDNKSYKTIEIMELIVIKKQLKNIIDVEVFNTLEQNVKKIRKREDIDNESLDVVQQFCRYIKKVISELTPIQQDLLIKLCRETPYNWDSCIIKDLQTSLTIKRLLYNGANVVIEENKLKFSLKDINFFKNNYDNMINFHGKEICFKVISIDYWLLTHNDRRKENNNLFKSGIKKIIDKEDNFKKKYKDYIKLKINEDSKEILIYIIETKEVILLINGEIYEVSSQQIQGKCLEYLSSSDSGIESLREFLFGHISYTNLVPYSDLKCDSLIECLCKLEKMI